ncbi:oxidoreductase [Luteolibacter sp. LG18]|uniref:oxidoreductase n=1 Tax=Luteolibacter sp. LG18 TaxID=2819286 RepID=UPI002B32413B|nr:short-chain dehydrogenase/reductase [Luteolibacter sp. LG18]
MNSKGKVWLVTGTSSGFGRRIVEELIARGEWVVATARDPRTVEDLVALAPERVQALPLDVTKPEEIHGAVAAAMDRFGRIDVLVNNAGYSVVGAVEETSEEELRHIFETMFFGAVAMTQAVLPGMRARGTGTLVQITSVGGFITAPGFGPYCAAKHALEALSEAMAAEVRPFGMRVLIVEPGAFRTGLFGSAFRSMPDSGAYASTVGATRNYAAHSAGAQAGDPVKAAKAIVDAVEAGCPSLRLPLGEDAIAGMRAKLSQVTADVDGNEAVAIATAY